MNESVGSKGTGSDDDPLVPDDFDDDFFKNLNDKVPEITKALRQKDTQDNADNVQRLLICANRYKSDLRVEEMRCVQLREEVKSLLEQIDNLEKMRERDQDVLIELRKVIESAWKQRDRAQMSEQIAQDENNKLIEKVESLEETVKQLNDKRSGLRKSRDESKEIENLKGDIKELHKRLQIQRSYVTEMEANLQSLEEKNKDLLKILDETSHESYQSKKQMDLLQKDFNHLKIEEVKHIEQINQLKSNAERLTKLKVRQHLQILSLKSNLEHLNSQHNSTNNKLAKITVELEYAAQDRDRYKRELNQRINMLKMREEEIIRLRQENGKLLSTQEATVRKYGNLIEARNSIAEENNRLKTQLNTQDKELESVRRILHQFEKSKIYLTKERDSLKRDLLVEHKTAEDNEELFQESQHEIKSLKDTVHLMDMKLKKMQEDCMKVNKEKAKKLDEIQNLIDRMDALKNDLHLKENYEIELKRTINDLELKCAKFQTQHELLIQEKNNLQRSLQAAEDDRTKLKQQIGNLQDSIETLRGKVSYRDAEISKLQLQLDRMEKERRMLKNEVRSAQLAHQHTRAELMEKKKENDRNSKALQEDAQKLSRLKKDMDNLINDKNVVSAALTKRNDERAQFKSKLENLQAAYDNAEKEYANSQDNIRLMRIEITNLRTERDVLRKDRENSANTRHELLQLHRVVNQERIKARALQEEMLTPMNVHRWRSLKGKDPEKMELIEQIQVLRKQILHYNVATLEKEQALIESQHLCDALKEFMMKLPSHKVNEQLNAVKANLSSKERKLKALAAELKTKAADEEVTSAKFEEMRQDLAACKLQLCEEKKKRQKLIDERQLLMQMQAQCFSAANVQRSYGAGFRALPTL